MNLHLVPYGQVPLVAKVLQISVLYLGWRAMGLNSLLPCANWHLFPYLQQPVSSQDRQSSVLYKLCMLVGAFVGAHLRVLLSRKLLGEGKESIA